MQPRAPAPIQAALRAPALLRDWPPSLRPQLCLATAAGIEMVYRSRQLGEARFLLRDAGTRCVVERTNARADETGAALATALAARARLLDAAGLRRLRSVFAWLESDDAARCPMDGRAGAELTLLRRLLAAIPPHADPALEKAGVSPAAVAALGTAHLAREDLASALAAADRVDATEPHTIGGVILLALTGRGVEASELLRASRPVTAPAVEHAWAQVAIRLQHWESAARSLRATVDPQRTDSLIAYANVSVEAGERDWASAAARRVLSLGASEEELLTALKTLVAVDRADEALEAVADLDARGAAGSEVLLYAAQVSLWRDRVSDCEAWLARAERDASLRPWVQRTRGGLAVREGHYDRALALLEPVLDAAPLDRETTLWMGEAHLRRGRIADGRAILERFDKLVTGEHPVAKLLHGLSRLEEEHRFAAGSGRTLYIHRNIAFDALGRRPHFTGAELDAERAFIWEAIEAFGGNRSDSLTLLDPRSGRLRSARDVLDPRVRVVAAQHRVLVADAGRVCALLDAQCDERPDVPYAHTYRAELDLWQGNYAPAARRYRQIWEETGTRWGYVGWGASLVGLGHFEEAIAVLDAGVEQLRGAIPGEATPAYRGAALRQLGRFDEALDELERAVALRPTRVGAWAELALTLRSLDRRDDAREAADRFIQDAPVLAWEAHRSLDLPPRVTPEEAHRWPVLERGLELMKGNRSSHLLTFFDAAGRWRVMEAHSHLERLVETARRVTAAAAIECVEGLLAELG